MTDITRPTRVLITDLIGLAFDADGQPDPSEVRAYIEGIEGCVFHFGPATSAPKGAADPSQVEFYYCPNVSTREELLSLCAENAYDALIAAATFIPAECRFDLGGVRIGAGTGNMGSESWGGGNGLGGTAPLMNTPGINSRATAQMVWKAVMSVMPDLPFDTLHTRVSEGSFDTGRHLRDFPTSKVEGQKLAVIGYGNIGREVAKLGKAFNMDVSIFARPRHKEWIEAEGFTYAATIEEAAASASVISVHLGLGPMDAERGVPANTGLINADVLSAMLPGSVLINFDRGELVDAKVLEAALASGQIGRAIIDADVFVSEETGAVTGPMAPYLPLLEKHEDKLCLLPHAAADTDHPTRVAGAKQAVDQILSVIRERVAVNAVGDLPDGLAARSMTPAGVGTISLERFISIFETSGGDELKSLVSDLHTNLEQFGTLDLETARGLMLDLNRLRSLMNQLGLEGPIQN
ncbi:NAD(P)-dependent oxidoreductase [Celeribacter sp.]|uniref:NAD(P)-dependent oxidoreductase n=1 Tax=Celeribacter sp. TaxID=1890673 RepID=UPI003A90831A